MKNALVTGAGGFLGGHLTNRLLDEGYNVACADIKPEKDWFQVSNKSKNFFNLNLRIKENCENVTNNIDLVFNLACDHGGIGHIMNNHYECMKDILINTHLIQASVDNKVQRYLYTSSACVYNTLYQEDLTSSRSLKESDAFPALPDSQYGWEKLFSEMLCEQYMKKHGIKVYLPRIHGCYGTHNHFNDGKEKAPNALTRKAILASNGNKEIEIWGDGKQERSFMYFEDCIDGFMKIINSNYHQPINLGSSKLVSINDCVDVLESILNTKFVRKYNLQGTQGVRSRNSDNSKILEILNWEPKKDINYGFSKLVDHINKKIKEI